MTYKKMPTQTAIVFIFGLTFFLIGGGCSNTSEKSVEEDHTRSQVTFEKPVITTPANDSSVEGPFITVKGKATPGYKIMAHNNYVEEDRDCVNHEGIPDGLDTVDASGDFEFILNNACKRTMIVFVSAIPEDEDSSKCISDENISETITFDISGELHGVCEM